MAFHTHTHTYMQATYQPISYKAKYLFWYVVGFTVNKLKHRNISNLQNLK